MKRSEMIFHIASELSGENPDLRTLKKATDLLDMIEGFGMLPPAYSPNPNSTDPVYGMHLTINEWKPE